jgi:hypothetical protein
MSGSVGTSYSQTTCGFCDTLHDSLKCPDKLPLTDYNIESWANGKGFYPLDKKLVEELREGIRWINDQDCSTSQYDRLKEKAKQFANCPLCGEISGYYNFGREKNLPCIDCAPIPEIPPDIVPFKRPWYIRFLKKLLK